MNSDNRLRICLAASGGGHLRQLLDLEAAWSTYDHFFLTEDTALSRSVAEKHRTAFVPHVALGQARLGAPFRMLALAAWNLVQSAYVIFRERPDVVLSTGAGSVYFGLLWARLIGAKIVVIESFARFDQPSAFAKIANPLAHRQIVQSAALLRFWPKANLFDPLRLLDTPPPKKERLLFVTVGATLPFDRMVKMVAELKERGEIPERIIVQTGKSGVTPSGLEVHETLPYSVMNSTMGAADIVVCHGGTGSLITALRQGCRVIAVPRLYELGEHYDNHQSEITGAFAARGLISVANTVDELRLALKSIRNNAPVLATTDASQLTQYLMTLLSDWSANPGSPNTFSSNLIE